MEICSCPGCAYLGADLVDQVQTAHNNWWPFFFMWMQSKLEEGLKSMLG